MSGRRRSTRMLVGGETRGRGGLILPGEHARRGVPQLFVPAGHETEEVVLVGKCLICEQTFYRGQEDEWQKHVGWCARKHLDEIRHEREKIKATDPFNSDNWDPEIKEHMRKVGERMKKEGRLTVHPHERAGFD